MRSRGNEGSVAAPHDILANVYTTATNTDWGPVPPAVTVQNDPANDFVVSIGQDSTITVPLTNTAFNINKVTGCNITLVAPLLSLNGVAMIFTSQTAAAHVITATALLRDGTAATRSTLTFAAQPGASVTLVVVNGLFNVQALQQVTVS